MSGLDGTDGPASPAPGDPLAAYLGFCRELKAARVPVTQGRVLDGADALHHVDWSALEDFRFALRANFASTPEEAMAFDRVFDAYWLGVESEGHRVKMRSEFLKGDLEEGEREGHDDAEASPLEYSDESAERDTQLLERWDDDAPPIEAAIRELARRLATRPSRRTRAARRRGRVDLRRTLQQSARRGADFGELRHAARRLRKNRLVMLCDVSGSMDAFNPFLLRLMLGVQKALPNSRTVVFSTEATEITPLLRRQSVARTLRDVSRAVQHWSGGTDLGSALGVLNRGVLREGAPRSTVAIIISDGYDQGDVEEVRREMTALRRRVRSVVWINPMYGSMSYQPTAKGMQAALPFVDHFLPAWDAASLRILVRELAKV